MRGFADDHLITIPTSLEHALELLSSPSQKWIPLSGGTDLMVLHESGILKPSSFLALWGLSEIKKIEISANEVAIGSGVSYSELRENLQIQSMFPMITSAAAVTGAIAIQNRGTLGGNIANASPAADTPPALIAYDAKIELVSSSGVRRIDYDRFHTGYKKTAMKPDELISKIILPVRKELWHSEYRKVGTRSAQAISKTIFAGSLNFAPTGKVAQIRLAFGSVGPTVIRARTAEAALSGKDINHNSIELALKGLNIDIAPIDDIRSTKEYRLKVSKNILEAFLTEIAKKIVKI